MNEEYKSMQDNQVQDIVSLPEGNKLIGCKQIFKTKRDSEGNVERYDTRHVAKGFTQREDIDFYRDFLFDFIERLFQDNYGSCCSF